MSDEHILTENERLRLVIDNLCAAIDVLNDANGQLVVSEILV